MNFPITMTIYKKKEKSFFLATAENQKEFDELIKMDDGYVPIEKDDKSNKDGDLLL